MKNHLQQASVEVSLMRTIWGKKCKLFVGAICALLVLFFAPKARGQAAYGTIIGTVQDPSGAAVPNATITVTDIGKGASRSTATNESGYYTVSNLVPGDYKVTV